MSDCQAPSWVLNWQYLLPARLYTRGPPSVTVEIMEAFLKRTCLSLSKGTLSGVGSEILDAETRPHSSGLCTLFELCVYKTYRHAPRPDSHSSLTVWSKWSCIYSGSGWYLYKASTVRAGVIKMLLRGEMLSSTSSTSSSSLPWY